jgi:hypothetical protein
MWAGKKLSMWEELTEKTEGLFVEFPLENTRQILGRKYCLHVQKLGGKNIQGLLTVF